MVIIAGRYLTDAERRDEVVNMFGDLETRSRAADAHVKNSPYIPNQDSVRGFVFDVATGKLNEVL